MIYLFSLTHAEQATMNSAYNNTIQCFSGLDFVNSNAILSGMNGMITWAILVTLFYLGNPILTKFNKRNKIVPKI